MTRASLTKISIGFIAGVAFLILASGLLLSKGKVLSERHQPFAFSESFDYNSTSFQDYIDYSQRLVRAAQVVAPSTSIVENASPFILEPGPSCALDDEGRYARGVVLSHGLVASPYSMRDIGEYFQSRCFFVMAILMPGHGTRPGDFLKVSWEDFAESQAFATRILAEKANQVFISGHSAGATLALHEAAINSDIDGLILFAPALAISSAAKYAQVPALLGKLFDGAAWFEILDDEAIYRYESFTFSGAAETYGLIGATETALQANPLSIPIFTVASVQDNTVDTETTLSLMAEQQNVLSRTLLYSQHPIAPVNNVIVYDSNAPEQKVLSISHLGLMVSPEHAHYGRDGAYRSCKHYVGQSEGSDVSSSGSNNLQLCRVGQRDYYGETTGENLAQGVVERIAFNPFFDDMLIELDRFLDSLPE